MNPRNISVMIWAMLGAFAIPAFAASKTVTNDGFNTPSGQSALWIPVVYLVVFVCAVAVVVFKNPKREL